MSIRSWAAIAAFSLVSAVSAPLVFAQDEANRDRGREGGGDRERGRFGGGGPGGPGGPGGGPGGMMGAPGGMLGRGGDNVMFDLLRLKEVQVEIELMPDQEEALKKLAERQRGERPDFNFREASEEERNAFFAKMQADMAKRSAEAKEQLEEILLPAQFERLEQLAVQARGTMGLIHADTAKSLAITEEQSTKLKAEMQTFGETAREQVTQAFRSGDRDAVREKMQSMRKELDAKLLAVLTDKQKADYEKLKGAPFDLPDMTMGGRGPGGPGGERGGPGGERGRGDRGPGGDRGRPATE